jgi:hypothetical protein
MSTALQQHVVHCVSRWQTAACSQRQNCCTHGCERALVALQCSDTAAVMRSMASTSTQCVTVQFKLKPDADVNLLLLHNYCYLVFFRRPWTYRAEEQYYDGRLLAILRSHRRELRNEAALLTFEHKVSATCSVSLPMYTLHCRTWCSRSCDASACLADVRIESSTPRSQQTEYKCCRALLCIGSQKYIDSPTLRYQLYCCVCTGCTVQSKSADADVASLHT